MEVAWMYYSGTSGWAAFDQLQLAAILDPKTLSTFLASRDSQGGSR